MGIVSSKIVSKYTMNSFARLLILTIFVGQSASIPWGSLSGSYGGFPVSASNSKEVDRIKKDVTSTDSTKTCSKDQFMSTLRVKVQFYEQAIVEAYKSTTSIRSSKSFRKTVDDMSTSASAGGGYGGFSAAVSGSYSKLTEEESSSSSYKKNADKQTTKYDPNYLQIVREVETILTIAGVSASSRKVDIGWAISVEDTETVGQLRERELYYTKKHFSGKPGEIRGNTYTESICNTRPAKKAGYQYADIELVNKKGDRGCFLEWYDTDKFYKFKDIGCRNDHATKAYLKGATKGTWITIYEDSDGRRDRSYTTIKVKGDMNPEETVEITSFEKDMEYPLAEGGIIEVKGARYDYRHHLDGEVCSVHAGHKSSLCWISTGVSLWTSEPSVLGTCF